MSDTDGTYGSGLDFTGIGPGTPPSAPTDSGADVPSYSVGAPLSLAPPDPGTQPAAPEAPDNSPSFGSKLIGMIPGPHYTAPDPKATALDQTADTLQQRIKRANDVATNPMLQFFNPEGVTAARNFIPQATEQLQKIRAQKADMQANAVQAQSLGLAPGEVPDEASMADRVAVAKSKALKGDLTVFKGLQAVDPKAAEDIQDQVHNAVAGHLTNAQLAFDSLAGMQNQGQYLAKLNQLQKDGTLTDLQALGLKVPPSFDAFNATKASESQALREARIGVDSIRQKLEERNTYQPMEDKEAKTYNGRLTTAYGDQVTNGTWARNGSTGTRGLVVNGAGDPRNLGKPGGFTLATPEQRKAIKEEFDGAVPKEDIEKYRAFNRTYQMATTDAKGNAIPSSGAADAKGNKTFVNTNPNVQQGVSEGLASMLRGGQGGANVGLLKIELAKRGWSQTAIDGMVSNYAGAVNTMFANADKPYLSQNTQKQIRDVMDVLKTYNDSNIGDRVGQVAQRAGALGLDAGALGFGKTEGTGAVGDAIEAGRQAQIARMMPNHQAIGGGDGVLQLNAQRPGAGATGLPQGTEPTTQLPGAQPLQTPVQQAQSPQPAQPQTPAPPTPSGGGAPPVSPAQPAPLSSGPPSAVPGPAGGAPTPIQIAGQTVTAPMPAGASPSYAAAAQRIESGREKSPWTATTKGSSASGAFQFTDGTWAENKPAGAPDRAKDATPAQQSEAFAKFTQDNATKLTAAGLPVNDTSLYVAHNLGAAGATKLMGADPSADARTVVGEAAARNNPLFFRGRPTVAKALERYQTEVSREPPTLQSTPDGTPMAVPATSLVGRLRSALGMGGTAPGAGTGPAGPYMGGGGVTSDQARDQLRGIGKAAVANAPAIGSTIGAVGGGVAGSLLPGPGTAAGAIGGGAVGGGAGQVLKDYLEGNKQSGWDIAKQTALGGVLGVAPEGRAIVGAASRVLGAGAVNAGVDAAQNGVSSDTIDKAVEGGGEALGGELFGRALGMAGHKVFSMFAPDAQKAVQTAAKTYAETSEVLKTEPNRLPGVGGAAGGPNPKYIAAEQAHGEAETVLKDAGLKPEEAAYAHQVSTKDNGNVPVPKGEAQASRPGAIEQRNIGQGYDQLRNEVGANGVGSPKATPKLSDGPRAAVENKQVSAAHAELADHVEAAITAPAPSWQAKWQQLQDARSQLLQAERDAQSSTAPGRTKIAADMRTLADTVRTQQAKAANYVFGPKDGPAFMDRLKVLDTRYRNLMDATNGGDLAAAARLPGDAGRAAERKFVAFAHDDPEAVAAYRSMRGAKAGPLGEATVPWTVAAEGLPVVGRVIKVAKLAGILREWSQARTAGSPARFADFAKLPRDDTGKLVRDLTATAAQRGAVQGDVLGGTM